MKQTAQFTYIFYLDYLSSLYNLGPSTDQQSWDLITRTPYKPPDQADTNSLHVKYTLVVAIGTFTDGYSLSVKSLEEISAELIEVREPPGAWAGQR
jgi:hypothetical protein